MNAVMFSNIKFSKQIVNFNFWVHCTELGSLIRVQNPFKILDVFRFAHNVLLESSTERTYA